MPLFYWERRLPAGTRLLLCRDVRHGAQVAGGEDLKPVHRDVRCHLDIPAVLTNNRTADQLLQQSDILLLDATEIGGVCGSDLCASLLKT